RHSASPAARASSTSSRVTPLCPAKWKSPVPPTPTPPSCPEFRKARRLPFSPLSPSPRFTKNIQPQMNTDKHLCLCLIGVYLCSSVANQCNSTLHVELPFVRLRQAQFAAADFERHPQ